jgi:hypothetical protein
MQRSSNESILQGFIIAMASFISLDIIFDFVWRKIIEVIYPMIIATESSNALLLFTRTTLSYNIAMNLLAIGAFLVLVNRFNVKLHFYHWIGFIVAFLLNSIIVNFIYLRL